MIFKSSLWATAGGKRAEIRPKRFSQATAKRKYTLTYMPTNTTAPTELIVNSMWLPHDELEVKVSGLKAAWSIELAIPGAKLTDGVGYTAAAKVVVGHNQTVGVGTAPVTITIMAKRKLVD